MSAGRQVIAALAVGLALVLPAPAAAKPPTAAVPLPNAGNLTVADFGFKAIGRVPSLKQINVKVLGKKKLPAGVSVIAGVAHEPGKKRRFVVRAVVVRSDREHAARATAGAEPVRLRIWTLARDADLDP